MRLLICAGGTGGGVYPALTVLQTIMSISPPGTNQILWVGGLGGMEANLVKRLDIPFKSIPAAGVHGVGIRSLPGNLLKLTQGFFAARQVIKQFQPDVVFTTGGYVAFPVALAAHFTHSGSTHPANMVYVPDIEPGLALKTLARFADRIAITSDDSRPYFPDKAHLVHSGYPVRSDLGKQTRQEAIHLFNLDTNLPTLLVFGGSKGARSINRAVMAVLPELLAEMQVLHITGNLGWSEIEQLKRQLSSEHTEYSALFNRRYRSFPYLHEEMGAALKVADLVLSRAGAACLGEFPHFGLPAILVPYPHAWHYQWVNAKYLEKHGAAMIVEDADLSTKIQPVILELMHNPQKRGQMNLAMKSLAHPQAASTIVNEIIALSRLRTT